MGILVAPLLMVASCGSHSSVQPQATTTSIHNPATGSAGVYVSGDVVSSGPGSDPIRLAASVGSRFGPGFSPLVSGGLGGLLYLAVDREEISSTRSDLRLKTDTADEMFIAGCDSFAINDAVGVACSKPSAEGSEIVVRSPDGELASWGSSSSDLVVIGWARDELILEEVHGEAGPLPTVLSVSEGAALYTVWEAAVVTAISPDGRRLLLDALVDGGNRSLIVDTTGKQSGAVRLGDATIILGAASWTQYGVAAAGFSVNNTEQYAVLLVADGADLVENARLSLPDGTLNGLAEPFLLESEGIISGWTVDANVRVSDQGTTSESPYRIVTCSIASRSCVLTPAGAANEQFGRIRTASRPADGGTAKDGL